LEFETEFARIVLAKVKQRGISLARAAAEMRVQYVTLRNQMQAPNADSYKLFAAASAWLGVTEESLRRRVFVDPTFPLEQLPTPKAGKRIRRNVDDLMGQARKLRENARQIVAEARGKARAIVSEAKGLEMRARMMLPPDDEAFRE
jgi:lambda repressor-like predicted transcriptional regulator